ncbi:MAG: Ca-activated chloride channel family protein [Myxococcota bacterium]
MVTIAKDVKIQVEFNPARVQAYRLIGYDNRRLVDRDFNDDTKDAGEIGAGHTVTALYEVVPVGVPFEHALDAPAYRVPAEGPGGSSLMTVKLRYKQPSASVSQLLTHPVADVPVEVADASTDMMHASSVAIFGSLLSKRPLGAAATAPLLRSLSGRGVGADRFGHRAEFGSLIGEAQRLHCF